MTESKCILEYCPTGDAIGDHQSENFVRHLVENKIPARVSTQNTFLAARAMIARGDISNEDICFLFQGELLPLDIDGCMERWPRGFCDMEESWLMELLKGRRT